MMIRSAAITSFVLAMLQPITASTMERYDLFSSHFQVLAPEGLQMDLDHRDALFGVSPFGKTIEKDLYYTTRLLCDNEEWPGTPDFIEQRGYVLMVDRGGCSFVTKVRNAQQANATAVVIADNACLCSAGPACASDKPCEQFEPVMDDDDSGSDITIPSMLLAKQDSDTLKTAMISGTVIHVQLSWPIPKTYAGVAHYTLWTSPNDFMSKSFLRTFKYAAASFGEKARFKPQMYLFDGAQMGCQNDGECVGRCTNGGRYCAPDIYATDGLSQNNQGTKVVIESLRRACIWDIYGQVDGIGSQWWDYASQWFVKCGQSDYSTQCAEAIFPHSEIDTILVNQCMDDSGGFRDDVENTILESMLEAAAGDDILFAPSLFVNGADLRGALSFGSVLGALCQTFDIDQRPGVCARWHDCESICPVGHTCILKDEECIEYNPLDTINSEIYDDDIFLENGVLAEQQVASSAPTAQEIVKTAAPSIVKSEATLLPTISPSRAPVEPPVPQKKPAQPDAIPTEQHNGEASVSETIQIYESGGGNNSGWEVAIFVIGISAGVGCLCVFCLGFFIAMRVLRRRRRRKRGTRQALIDPVAEMLDSDDYEYADDDDDDIDDYQDE